MWAWEGEDAARRLGGHNALRIPVHANEGPMDTRFITHPLYERTFGSGNVHRAWSEDAKAATQRRTELTAEANRESATGLIKSWRWAELSGVAKKGSISALSRQDIIVRLNSGDRLYVTPETLPGGTGVRIYLETLDLFEVADLSMLQSRELMKELRTGALYTAFVSDVSIDKEFVYTPSVVLVQGRY